MLNKLSSALLAILWAVIFYYFITFFKERYIIDGLFAFTYLIIAIFSVYYFVVNIRNIFK